MENPSDHSASGTPPKRNRAASLGRKLGLGVYMVVLVYVICVGFATLLPAVFWPKSNAEEPSGSCQVELAALEDSLLLEGQRRVSSAPTALTAPHAPDDFFQRWDATFVALGPACADDPGYGAMARLRYHYETTLRRFAREDGVLIHRANEALNRSPEAVN